MGCEGLAPPVAEPDDLQSSPLLSGVTNPNKADFMLENLPEKPVGISFFTDSSDSRIPKNAHTAS